MNIFDEVRNNPKFNSKNSWTWFQTNVRDLAASRNVTPLRLMSDTQAQVVTSISPGSLYCCTFPFGVIGKTIQRPG